jgi:hypothetical protein
MIARHSRQFRFPRLTVRSLMLGVLVTGIWTAEFRMLMTDVNFSALFYFIVFLVIFFLIPIGMLIAVDVALVTTKDTRSQIRRIRVVERAGRLVWFWMVGLTVVPPFAVIVFLIFDYFI